MHAIVSRWVQILKEKHEIYIYAVCVYPPICKSKSSRFTYSRQKKNLPSVIFFNTPLHIFIFFKQREKRRWYTTPSLGTDFFPPNVQKLFRHFFFGEVSVSVEAKGVRNLFNEKPMSWIGMALKNALCKFTPIGGEKGGEKFSSSLFLPPIKTLVYSCWCKNAKYWKKWCK